MVVLYDDQEAQGVPKRRDVVLCLKYVYVYGESIRQGGAGLEVGYRSQISAPAARMVE